LGASAGELAQALGESVHRLIDNTQRHTNHTKEVSAGFGRLSKERVCAFI